MDFASALVALILMLVVVVVVFLICREIVCWYWKINQSVALLTEIRDLLALQNARSNQADPRGPGAAVP